MREEENQKTEQVPADLRETAHPWLDLPVDDDTIGEPVRCSLDEIRFA